MYFQQDSGAHFDPATQRDPITGYPDSCAAGTLGVLCATSSRLHNYGFDNFAGFPNTRDVGLVILDQQIALPEYGQLPQAGVLDSLATARGRKDTVFTVSGYGLSLRVQEHSALANISFRERLMAQSTLVDLRSALTGGYNLATQGGRSSSPPSRCSPRTGSRGCAAAAIRPATGCFSTRPGTAAGAGARWRAAATS